MKRKIKYIVVILLFVIIMSLIICFFMKKYETIKITNQAKHLLEYLYTIDEGEYSYKDGIVISDSKTVVKDNYYINGEGKINVDKYGNVEFFINTETFCINKTYMDNINIINKKCDGFSSFNVKLIKNNSKISFTSLKENLSYKVSSNDDFKGEWVTQDYSGNLIINTYNEGTNYIWFKDNNGNLSDVLTFNVDCLNTNNTKYNKDVFYCSGSVIEIDNFEWIVIKDLKNEITLMKVEPIEEKFSHCEKEKSDYCYYTENSKKPYKWSNSKINNYLNNIFINDLSDNTKKMLVQKYICDEYDNFNCDNDGCGGYNKNTILSEGWKCTNYTPSKIRIISFEEYNYIFSKIGKSELIEGKYWMINSFSNENGASVDENYDVYIRENATKELDVFPVITLAK